nr:Chain A, Competence-stimulating peptide type 1 [Streptococcus pneumoniae]
EMRLSAFFRDFILQRKK